MPQFGPRSLRNLEYVHPLLRKVLDEAIKTYDFTVICGYRGRQEQEEAFRKGTSKAHFGQSAHNYNPAVAVDLIPYPFKDADWDDLEKFKELARHILAAADAVGVPVRWGGDWNMNGKISDERFLDTPHFELHPWRDYAR